MKKFVKYRWQQRSGCLCWYVNDKNLIMTIQYCLIPASLQESAQTSPEFSLLKFLSLTSHNSHFLTTTGISLFSYQPFCIGCTLFYTLAGFKRISYFFNLSFFFSLLQEEEIQQNILIIPCGDTYQFCCLFVNKLELFFSVAKRRNQA